MATLGEHRTACCPGCGQPVPAQARFCQNCAYDLSAKAVPVATAGEARVCSVCGVSMGPDAQFCGNCGAAVARHPAAILKVLLGAVILVGVVGAYFILVRSTGRQITISFEEKLLATIPEQSVMRDTKHPLNLNPNQITFSPDGHQVAYKAQITRQLTTRYFVVVGNKSGPEFDDVNLPSLSFDGRRVAYAGKADNKWFVVDGDKKGPDFDSIGFIRFSPDGSKMAYCAREDNKWFLMVQGKRGPEFDGCSWPVFSTDGNKVVYTAARTQPTPGGGFFNKWFVVVGDEVGPEFDFVSSPTFSPDGARVAYIAQERGTGYLVVGNKQNRYGRIVRSVGNRAFCPVFAPNGTIAYSEPSSVIIGAEHVPTWKDSTRSPTFDLVGCASFSPDGSKVAYAASLGGEWFVNAGNNRGPEFDWIASKLVFSPDGSKIAYGVRQGRELWWKVMDVR